VSLAYVNGANPDDTDNSLLRQVVFEERPLATFFAALQKSAEERDQPGDRDTSAPAKPRIATTVQG